MKKLLLLLSLICALLLGGCGEIEYLSDNYEIGQEYELGGHLFNLYKVDDRDELLYLWAQESIATTQFSNDEHSGFDANEYEGSLVEIYVEEYVEELESQGVNIVSSGIMDSDDLFEIAQFENSSNPTGRPYMLTDESPAFIDYVDSYWLGGYCKYRTYSYAYVNHKYDTYPCDEEYGVRPIIVVEPAEVE